jgi:hypothetical protein
MSTYKDLYDLERFKSLFNYIVTEEYCQVVMDHPSLFVNDENFTHLYKEQIDKETKQVRIRPIFDFSKFEVVWTAIIVKVFHDEKVLEKFHILKDEMKRFLLWMKYTLDESYILFTLLAANNESSVFYGTIHINLVNVVNTIAEKLYEK